MPPSPLALLRRSDKWYLGSGDGLIWAPPFPAWHDTPGFWDDAHFVQYPVGPLFSIAFIQDGQAGLPPRARVLDWTPAALTLEYELGNRVHAMEVRTAPGDRVLASEWEIGISGRRPAVLDVVLWTAVDGESVADDGATVSPEGVRLTRTVRDRKDQELRLHCDYRLTGGRATGEACRSELSGRTPDFRLTPFYDRWKSSGKLASEAHLAGIDRRGLVYAALARRLRILPGRTVRFVASVQLAPTDLRTPAPVAQPDVWQRPTTTARRGWENYQQGLPRFGCSDPWLNRYWWYRWYGLRLNAVPAGLGQYDHRSVCEGIGYFHQPISYSAMCHAREVRWAADPEWSHGVVETFFDRLGPEGAMPGRVYLDHLQQPDFYHADWGGALGDVGAVHPDPARLARIYPKVARYAEWLSGTRDRESSGMIDVIDQYETGQEYMSRYQAVDPSADQYGWENRLRLKGIDVTVYAYRLFQLLERLAPDDLRRASWRAQAHRVRNAVHRKMWDPDRQMFFDVNPQTGGRTGVKAAVCFYPYLTDIAGPEHLEGLAGHLFDSREFWTPFPAPSSSVDDPLYSPDAEWKGKRHVCPWNGRVWPMTNSHLIDALARVTRRHRPEWAPKVVDFVQRFVRMMSYDGDATRPNCFEHYHPITGRGSIYRGIDDYQHSWVNDLIVRHVVGLIPRGEAGIVVDPLPFGVNAKLSGARVAGRTIDVALTPRTFRAWVNGMDAARGTLGIPVEIAW